MTTRTRKIVAIDIDDVVAATSEAVRVWANHKLGATLTSEDYFITDGGYWNYYEEVWKRHGLEGRLSLEGFLKSTDRDQSHVSVVQDAQRVIAHLKKNYTVIFITARRPINKESTRRWLDEHIDAVIPLYLSMNPFSNEAAQSKRQICAELGVDLLIDDNVDNCESAEQHGVNSIVFGNYGWNVNAPASATRCLTWRDVEAYLGEQH